jgi:hypothetical protein
LLAVLLRLPTAAALIFIWCAPRFAIIIIIIIIIIIGALLSLRLVL